MAVRANGHLSRLHRQLAWLLDVYDAIPTFQPSTIDAIDELWILICCYCCSQLLPWLMRLPQLSVACWLSGARAAG